MAREENSDGTVDEGGGAALSMPRVKCEPARAWLELAHRGHSWCPLWSVWMGYEGI